MRHARTALIAAVVALAVSGCGDEEPARDAQVPPATTQTAPGSRSTPPPTATIPAPDAEARELLELLVPEGVPTTAKGEPADAQDLAVVERWLAALTLGDIPAAADTFADGAVVQNLQPPIRLTDRALRIRFNDGFPCGAELSSASSVKGYLVVTYRLTDRKSSPCDGPGGSAAGTIKVEGGKMTEWYRLPNPPAGDEEEPGPVV